MTMESLGALGLVANIITLVDYASKAFNVCHEIYSRGASIDDSRLATTSKELNQSYSVLRDSLNRSATAGLAVSHDVDLKAMALRCCDTATALSHELLLLNKFAVGGFRKTISKASLKIWKGRKIEHLKRDLDGYQKALDSKLIIDVRENLGTLRAEQQVGATNLQQQLSVLSANLEACHLPISNQVRSEIDAVINIIKEQHANTRQHVKSETDRAINTAREQHAMTRQHTETHIVSALQDLEMSHNRHHIERFQMQQLQREYLQRHYHQFLESLWFSDMNLRMSEVSPSHVGTFQWIFDDTMKHPWSSFSQWLTGNDCLYFVQGKPGSGKSTLMKFLAKESRTMELLQQWSSNNNILIVSFYFWLSGSKLQRSLKGLLCSLVRQIMQKKKRLFNLLSTDESLIAKRHINDWSVGELQRLLKRTISISGPICILIDGLDELDQEEDMDNLLNFIENPSPLGMVKICVSSRPESYIMKRMSRYSRVRLQDLTAADIQKYIHDKLQAARFDCSPTVVDDERLAEIIERMTDKAEGVFLWVHYALNSLIHGMRSADDFEELLAQIDELPRGMNQLYSQMWNRLNENQQRYRDEAAIYFSYEGFYPRSVFQMLVATDSSIQGLYFDNFKPLNVVELAKRCERLTTRMITRTAGMLEIVADPEPEPASEPDLSTISGSGSDNARIRTSVGNRNVDPAAAKQGTLAPGYNTAEKLYHEPAWSIQYRSKVNFLHRTARDYLVDTTDGRNIYCKPGDPNEDRFPSIARAEMASVIQGFEDFNTASINSIMGSIRDSGTGQEIELVKTLKKTCEHLSLPNEPKRNIGYREFWIYSGDFECAAAQHACSKYIHNFFLHHNTSISPYYQGWLLIGALKGLNRPPNFKGKSASRYLGLISWLLSTGADVLTKHVYGVIPVNVALVFLSLVLQPKFWSNFSRARQAVESFQILLPLIRDSSVKYVVWLDSENYWRMEIPFAEDLPVRFLPVRMTMAKLCLLAMRYVDKHVPFDLQWSCDPVRGQDHATEVLLDIQAFSSEAEPLYRSNEDSWYLGEAIDEILFWDESSSSSRDVLLEAFNARLAEVRERNSGNNYTERSHGAGWMIKKNRLSERNLDPSEDVDESNWTERGHFKKLNEFSESRLNDPKNQLKDRIKAKITQ